MQDHVWLNDKLLPIVGKVKWFRVTPFPSQFITNKPDENDYTPTRKQKWGSLKGGLGKDKWTPNDNDRYSEAANVDASRELTTLGALVTTMGSFGVEPVKILKYDKRIWAIGHNKIAYWTGSAWTTAKSDLPHPTDGIVYYGTF